MEHTQSTSRAQIREQNYVAMEQRVQNELEMPTSRQALAALRKCPRRSGLPALGTYYCECPVCSPEEWGLDQPE